MCDAANRLQAWNTRLQLRLEWKSHQRWADQLHLECAGSAHGCASAIFAYDGIGRRRGKTIGSTTTNFLYDGLAFVQEQSSGGTPLANLFTGLRIDETFSRTDASGHEYLLVDALGIPSH
jgi:hypothetical protein